MSNVAACLYVRNAEHDITEWIAYHHVIGIRAFLIYDNGSTDTTVAQAQTMAFVTDIRIIPWGHATGPGAQTEAYENCFRLFQHEFEWILVLDNDEYLSSTAGLQIGDLLSHHFFSAAIAFNWACFGSNGHAETPNELTIKAFTRRSDHTFGANNHVKLVVRPELVREVVSPHYFEVDGQIKRVNGQQVIWNAKGLTEHLDLSQWFINHYFVRSYAQWEAKLARGYRDATQRDKDLFNIYDRNEVLDEGAAVRANEVQLLLEKARCYSQHKSVTRGSWLFNLFRRR